MVVRAPQPPRTDKWEAAKEEVVVHHLTRCRQGVHLRWVGGGGGSVLMAVSDLGVGFKPTAADELAARADGIWPMRLDSHRSHPAQLACSSGGGG